MALGAFGAHGLKARLSPEALAIWNTAVQYHLWHGLGLLAVGLAMLHFKSVWLGAAGGLLVAGLLLFCGSLYALALGAPRALGMVAPIGGVALIGGWVALALGFISARTPG